MDTELTLEQQVETLWRQLQNSQPMQHKRELAELQAERDALAATRPPLVDDFREKRNAAVAAKEEVLKQQTAVRIIQGQAGQAGNKVAFLDDALREIDRKIAEVKHAAAQNESIQDSPVMRNLTVKGKQHA